MIIASLNAKVVGTNKKSDVAVLKIEASDLPTLEIADSDASQIGEWVLAVGNPFDLNSTVTAGIISAKGRSIQLLGGGDAIESFIQTDAAVNPGNSGGALVDAEGRLLGINTAIATRTGVFSGYSFAIPINLVTRIANDIIEFGSFQRAFLGVNIYELDSDEAEELGVQITQGVVIEKLVDGGSAQYAGLQPKDIIVSVDGKEVKTVPELQEIIGQAKVGDQINVSVMRQGEMKEIPVVLKADLLKTGFFGLARSSLKVIFKKLLTIDLQQKRIQISFYAYKKTCLKLVFRFVLMRLSCSAGQTFFFCPLFGYLFAPNGINHKKTIPCGNKPPFISSICFIPTCAWPVGKISPPATPISAFSANISYPPPTSTCKRKTPSPNDSGEGSH